MSLSRLSCELAMTVEARVVDEPVARVMQLVQTASEPDRAGDYLNSAMFVEEHGERVRYSPELSRWFVWNGSWWEEDRTEVVCDLARQTIDGLRQWAGRADSPGEFKSRAAHYKESSRAPRRDGMLAIARTDRAVAVAVDDLDRHPHLLACRNGTVDLRSGELRAARGDDLLTRGVGLDFVPGAASEAWDRFLDTIFDGDHELLGYVQRLAGYSATGEAGEHVLPIAYGTGANGKTQFARALQIILGEHAMMAPEGLLVQQRNSQHEERKAVLRGRRLVISDELEQRSTLAEGLVKSLTGAARLSARHLYGRRFDFTPTHTIWLLTNFPPRVNGTDEAIWRRLRLVPFAVTIPVAERIPDYGSWLATEHGQAILAWVVQGAVEYYANGLGEAEAVATATMGYRESEDTFQHFLEDSTVPIGGRTPVKQLRGAWTDWAKANDLRPGRDQDFVRALESHGVEVVGKRTRFAVGIGLLPGLSSDVHPLTPPAEKSPLVRVDGEVYDRGVLRGASDFADELPRAIESGYWSTSAADDYMAGFEAEADRFRAFEGDS